MKRRLSLILVLAMLLTSLGSNALFALGESPEAEEAFEEEAYIVSEVDEYELPEDDGDDIVEDVVEAPVAPDIEYARVKQNAVDVCDAVHVCIASLQVADVVLMTGEPEDGMIPVAFNTVIGVVEGFVPEDALEVLDDAEYNALMDDLALTEGVMAYREDLDRLLPLIDCAFPGKAETPEEPEATEEEPAEDESATKMFAPGSACIDVYFDGKRYTDGAAPVYVGYSVKVDWQVYNADGTPIEPDSGSAGMLSGKEYASFDNTEKTLTGVKVGEDTLKVSVTFDGMFVETAIPVRVMPEPAAVVLNKSSLTIGYKETYDGLCVLECTSPDGEVFAPATWKSGNTKYVKIKSSTDTSCVLYGVKAGKATVTATLFNGVSAKLTVTVKAAPSKVTVTPTKADMYVGGTGQIAAKVNSGAASASYTYVSNNAAVATVDKTGMITGVGKGTATITTRAYNGKTATTKVTVYGSPDHVTVDLNEAELLEGQSFDPSARMYDAEDVGTVAPFACDISDPDCVSVNPATGVITALRSGEATIVYGFEGCEDEAKTATVHVAVTGSPESIAFNQGAFKIGIGESYEGLSIVPVPHEWDAAEDIEAVITWKSSSKSIAAVTPVGDYGCIIQGKKAGKATITATTHNGKSCKIGVTVAKKPTKVTLKPATLNLSLGGMTGKFTPTANSGAASGSYTYEVEDESIATVDAAGNITALAEGTTRVKATSYNGKSGMGTVVVYPEPASFEFTPTAVDRIIACQTGRASAFGITDANGAPTYANVTYFTSDPDIVEIDPVTGYYTAVAGGDAVIGARLHNGLEQTCPVHVIDAPEDIDIGPDTIYIGYGESVVLNCELIAPEGAETCDAAITWSTSKSAYVSVTASADKKSATVKGKTKGQKATVTVKTHNGLKKTVVVYVKAKPTKLTVKPSPVVMTVGNQKQLTATVNSGAASYGITYESENPEIVSVDENGLLTGIAVRDLPVCVNVRTYNGLLCEVLVTVKKPPVRMEVAQTAALSQGMTYRIEPVPYDEDGCETIADFAYDVIDGGDCLTVDANGVATALKAGTAHVKVRIKDARPDAQEISKIVTFTTYDAPATLEVVSANGAQINMTVQEQQAPLRITAKTASGVTLPEGSYGLTYTFTKGKKIATVNEDNVVVCNKHKNGPVEIRVTTHNGVKATVGMNFVRKLRIYAYYGYDISLGRDNGALAFPKQNATSFVNTLKQTNMDKTGLRYAASKTNGFRNESGIVSELASIASVPGEADLTVIYMCSHGSGKTSPYIWQLPDDYPGGLESGELYERLVRIPGDILLIIDSCYSGQFIRDKKNDLDKLDGKITVLTASSSTRACYYKPPANSTKNPVDFFTYFMLYGLGYEERDGQSTGKGKVADSDGDGAVSVAEMFNYASKYVKKYMPQYSKYSWFWGDKNQSPIAYAGGLGDTLLFG